MTPERWRAVDVVLQAALECEPARRDTFIAEACEGDEPLRMEVASLLAAHVEASDDFLEQPAAPELISALSRALDTPKAEPPRGRSVSARAALYAAAIMFVIGVAGGTFVGRWSVLRSSDAAVASPVGSTLLTVVDRAGREVRGIPAERPWTPRFSPDGQRIAYGAFAGRGTSDLFVTNVESGVTERITDDDADANDPQWSADGARLAFSVSASGGKDIALKALGGAGDRIIAERNGTQFPSDWLRDGSALLVTEETGGNKHDILVQPADGSPARPYAATAADETAARISPDGHWVAYTSDASGRAEVYLDAYPQPKRRVRISAGGGMHPVWRSDGKELYYWRDGALVAVQMDASVPRAQAVLFRAAYSGGVNTMYDVSPDGQRFVIAREP